ncbi:SEL1-like repeat protein [Streptomyces sp. NPDC002491]
MKWGKLRPWLGLIGPLLAVVVLTATPAGLKAGELSWPKWLVAGLVAVGGVLLAVWTPLVKARTDALVARVTRATERDAQAEGALSRLPALKGKIPLVKEVTDRTLLDIHEAIPLPTDSLDNPGLSAELPTYVARDIDAELRTNLEARRRTGGFVLLVGPAAAGKTRCAYEAIRAVLPSWRLFMPGDAATLTDLVTSEADLKHSVVWLNETQNFLAGSDRLKASTVRRLLADTARPVILIGTIWPTTYEQLRTPAPRTDSDTGATEDLNRNAREVLDLARRFSIGTWSDQEWARAEELASIDPRIGQASRHRGQTGLAQILSAAPELIHRWEQADNPFGQALITAAVVARRCNHPDVMPEPLIAALAQDFLTGNQRATADEGWLAEALAWACSSVYHSGGIAPLQAIGESVGQVDGYQVSDILVDHTAPSAPISEQQITSRVWRRMAELAAPEACLAIGTRAYFTSMKAEATIAWRRAADVGDIQAGANLGVLLHEQGDVEGACTWYTRAAEAGHTDAMYDLGIILVEQGDDEGARTWWTRAADNGDTSAMYNLGVLSRYQADEVSARTWWTRAADNGYSKSMYNLGILLHEQGNADGARTWYTRAAEAGHTDAMCNLGRLLHEQGDTEGARTWWTRAADDGDTSAMYNLGVLSRARGDDEGARTWLTRAANSGDTSAMYNLGNLVRDRGDTEGARTWYTRAADNGHTKAMYNLGRLLHEQGDTEGASTWWTLAAAAGHTNAAAALFFHNQAEN